MSVDEGLLARLDGLLTAVPFPADKDEVLEAVTAAGGEERLRWLLQAMPGWEFQFAGDVLSTARIALQMRIHRPWPDQPPATRSLAAETLAGAVATRLRRCPGTNSNLIRVTARGGTVFLAGRTPDVPGGVMAARVAVGLAPQREVVNRLQVLA
ncbi:MAG: DUF2795 domain-containing protein [Fimbriimonadaceae bacterium]|nr:DUF2795 domain-containing protein [Fimbriimonadaceae bacterium]